jgi:hypothetical protein
LTTVPDEVGALAAVLLAAVLLELALEPAAAFVALELELLLLEPQPAITNTTATVSAAITPRRTAL